MFMYLLISSREFGRKEAVSRPRDSCWTVSVPEPSGQAESGLTRTRILRECCLPPPPAARGWRFCPLGSGQSWEARGRWMGGRSPKPGWEVGFRAQGNEMTREDFSRKVPRTRVGENGICQVVGSGRGHGRSKGRQRQGTGSR